MHLYEEKFPEALSDVASHLIEKAQAGELTEETQDSYVLELLGTKAQELLGVCFPEIKDQEQYMEGSLMGNFNALKPKFSDELYNETIGVLSWGLIRSDLFRGINAIFENMQAITEEEGNSEAVEVTE